jgi:class 3 adenylate cyclase/tetratricopeptide (TPR) repeat protein
MVTILTSDLAGSTSLGERLDPESLREIVSLYFDAMTAVIESHGGVIEKFSGDAILALFGERMARPDDALRAVLAAAETQGALVGLNDVLDARWGVRLANRTGVATGRLVIGEAGAGGRVLTGSAMTLATALEQAAPTNAVLIDDATRRAAGAGVQVSEVDRVRPKGGTRTSRAFRLRAIAEREHDLARGDAAAPTVPGVTSDRRKTVTIAFVDLEPRRSDGRRADARQVRTVMARVFEPIRDAFQHHGGTVEKYIGDAIMAVFGLPVRHEDDALRAVRAALDTLATIDGLRPGLLDELGIDLHVAIGVNSGSVVAGDATLGQRLATGDAVNVAARLEQSAPAGAILVGELTRQLVGDAVDAAEVEPLSLKGKAVPVRAYRITGLRSGAPATGAASAPLVGREAEMTILRSAFDSAMAASAPRLVTLIGDAGVGKTRLTDEFLDSARGAARVLRGGCLAYGDGITFWPIAEVIRDAAGILATDPPAIGRRKLRAVVADPAIVDRVATAIGLSDRSFQVAELFWGIRRFLAALASDRPLVVVLDDIHWAEATLLELIEHLVGAMDEAPILLLCGARPTLLEDHPDWGTGDPDRRIVLEPLGPAEAGRIAAGLLGGAQLDAVVLERIVVAAEGNPLFVGQLLAMLIEDGSLRPVDGRWESSRDLATIAIPPTIEALLAARLDGLPDRERTVVDPASVIGVLFARPAVESLLDAVPADDLSGRLTALVARQLVRPDTDASVGEDVFRFGHVLIRDAAYGGMLKRTRADLHERFVAWADVTNEASGRAMEFEEILGYHLEQAHRYRRELSPLDEHATELGIRASVRLASAGRRALARGDNEASGSLLRRAVDLLPAGHRERPGLLLALAETRFEAGAAEDALAVLDAAAAQADALHDRAAATAARLEHLQVRYLIDPSRIVGPVEPQVRSALRVLEDAGDHAGQARGWRFLSNLAYAAGRWASATDAIEHVIEQARLAGDEALVVRMSPYLAIFATEGTTPVHDALALSELALSATASDQRAQALTLRARARLHAMTGAFDVARDEYRRARRILEDLGNTFAAALTGIDSGPIELLAGDPVAAEAELRRDHATLERLDDRNFITTVAAYLADAVLRQGRDKEADDLAAFSAGAADPDDLVTQIAWRCVRGRVAARRGDPATAVALVEEAVARSRESDDPVGQANALVDLAEVLGAAGREDDAARAIAEARALYAAKGAIAYLARLDATGLTDPGTGPSRPT